VLLAAMRKLADFSNVINSTRYFFLLVHNLAGPGYAGVL
jgi:hypothetical protein